MARTVSGHQPDERAAHLAAALARAAAPGEVSPVGFSLDLDSTVFSREGKQEGAAKGFSRKDAP
jgi:hypothetical protein